MSTQPRAATDLLWAYQLKREHQHLLTRIQGIESTNTRQDARIAAAEQSALHTRDTDVSALAQQVQALQDGGFKKRADLLERKFLERLEEVQAEGEAMCLKVDEMEKGVLKREEDERKKTFQREKSLLKRIGGCEAVIKKVVEEDAKLSERDDGEVIEDLRVKIDQVKEALAKQVNEANACLQGVSKLEQMQQDLSRRVDGLKDEIAEIAAEASRTAQATFVPSQSLAGLMPPPLPSRDNPLTQKPTQRPSEKAAETPPPPKQAVSHKTKMLKELAALGDRTEPAAAAAQVTKPVVQKGPGWIAVERTPSAVSLPRASKIQQSIETGQSQSQDVQGGPRRGPGRPRKRKMTVVEDDEEEAGPVAEAQAPEAGDPKNKKRKVAAPAPANGDSQTTATQRQTRSQVARRARVPSRKAPKGRPVPVQVTRKVSKWMPKGPRKRAAVPEPTVAPAAPEKRGSGRSCKNTAIQVASSEALTDIDSPSPAPARTEKRQVPQQKTGRRRLELDGTDEEFGRKCREVLGQ